MLLRGTAAVGMQIRQSDPTARVTHIVIGPELPSKLQYSKPYTHRQLQHWIDTVS